MTSGGKRLNLLGGFRIEIDGCPMAVPGAASKLFALLALHDRDVSRAEIAGTFWPELGDRRAFANLRTVLWRLPPSVQSMVRSTTPTMVLADDVNADVREVRHAVRRVLDHGEIPDGGHELINLLCRPLLPELDEHWLVFERERLRQLHIHALERIGERHLTNGDPMTAVDVASAVITAEPLRESAHALLIRAHEASGNRVDAQRAYDHYCAILRRELGVPPSECLRREHASLTRR